jgi:hypothetical protein
VPPIELQKTPWPGIGSLRSALSKSLLKCAFALRTLPRSAPDNRWKMNQLSPWLRTSTGMLPGCWGYEYSKKPDRPLHAADLIQAFFSASDNYGLPAPR